MGIPAIVREASHALCANDADMLEQLCSDAEQQRGRPTPRDPTEYADLLRVLRRQVLAARANVALRQRLLAQHTEAVWVR